MTPQTQEEQALIKSATEEHDGICVPKVKQVLLIEDDEDAMILVKYALAQHGRGQYELQWAQSLQDGFLEVATGHIDLTILDLGLPGTSGVASYESMKRAVPWIPIVVLSAEDSKETQDLVLSGGTDDFLLKQNLTGGSLWRAVDTALKNYERWLLSHTTQDDLQKTILLIEDDEDAMILVQHALEQHGNQRYCLNWASSIASALQFLAQSKADLVLMDLSLPDLSGGSACMQLKAAAPDTPIVVLTGTKCVETEFDVLSLGVDGYLEKSQTSGTALVQVMREVLFESRRRHMRRHFDSGGVHTSRHFLGM